MTRRVCNPGDEDRDEARASSGGEAPALEVWFYPEDTWPQTWLVDRISSCLEGFDFALRDGGTLEVRLVRRDGVLMHVMQFAAAKSGEREKARRRGLGVQVDGFRVVAAARPRGKGESVSVCQAQLGELIFSAPLLTAKEIAVKFDVGAATERLYEGVPTSTWKPPLEAARNSMHSPQWSFAGKHALDIVILPSSASWRSNLPSSASWRSNPGDEDRDEARASADVVAREVAELEAAFLAARRGGKRKRALADGILSRLSKVAGWDHPVHQRLVGVWNMWTTILAGERKAARWRRHEREDGRRNPGDEDRDEARASALVPVAKPDRVQVKAGSRVLAEDAVRVDVTADEVVVTKSDATSVVLQIRLARLGGLAGIYGARDNMPVTSLEISLVVPAGQRCPHFELFCSGRFANLGEMSAATGWQNKIQLRLDEHGWGDEDGDVRSFSIMPADGMLWLFPSRQSRRRPNPGDEDRDEARASHSKRALMFVAATPCHDLLAERLACVECDLTGTRVIDGERYCDQHPTPERVAEPALPAELAAGDVVRVVAEKGALSLTKVDGSVVSFRFTDYAEILPVLDDRSFVSLEVGAVASGRSFEFVAAGDEIFLAEVSAAGDRRVVRLRFLSTLPSGARHGWFDEFGEVSKFEIVLGLSGLELFVAARPVPYPRPNPGDEDRDEARASSTPASLVADMEVSFRFGLGEKWEDPLDVFKIVCDRAGAFEFNLAGRGDRLFRLGRGEAFVVRAKGEGRVRVQPLNTRVPLVTARSITVEYASRELVLSTGGAFTDPTVGSGSPRARRAHDFGSAWRWDNLRVPEIEIVPRRTPWPLQPLQNPGDEDRDETRASAWRDVAPPPGYRVYPVKPTRHESLEDLRQVWWCCLYTPEIQATLYLGDEYKSNSASGYVYRGGLGFYRFSGSPSITQFDTKERAVAAGRRLLAELLAAGCEEDEVGLGPASCEEDEIRVTENPRKRNKSVIKRAVRKARLQWCQGTQDDHDASVRQYCHTWHYDPPVVCAAREYWDLPRQHRAGVMAHEIGHLLAGHSGSEQDADDAFAEATGHVIQYRDGRWGKRLQWIDAEAEAAMNEHFEIEDRGPR